MSRFENVVQASSHDGRISHRLPCGKCSALIEYDQGAGWPVVNELVNEHWKACPENPHAGLARMTSTPTSPLDTAIVLPPPIAPEEGSNSNLVAESVSSASNAWISVGCERKRRTLEQRKSELEQDEYARNVTTKSVVCGGCHKEISLDKRSEYYPGLWRKHRGKCPSIEKLERAKDKAPQVLNGTRPVSCDAVIPTFGGHDYGDVLQLSPAERYESHSAASTHQLVRHYDLEDLESSEDEEDDEDLLAREPFPTLNNVFYRSQQLYNHSDVWAYRYATKEEITTNIFHGQDEPCARLGARPFTHLGLQTGGHCEISRCVIENRVDQAASHPDNFRLTKELSKPGEDIAALTLPWEADPLNFAEGRTV